jgi:aconitase B
MIKPDMAETLGSLCDKLTIIKLKQWHSTDKIRLKSLAAQESSLLEEIDEFIANALVGRILENRLTFQANKVYKKKGNAVAEVTGAMGAVIARLADVNCRLWHEQEKVYDFEHVPDAEKGALTRQLAILNLERNRCIEAIDLNLLAEVVRRKRVRKPPARRPRR